MRCRFLCLLGPKIDCNCYFYKIAQGNATFRLKPAHPADFFRTRDFAKMQNLTEPLHRLQLLFLSFYKITQVSTSVIITPICIIILLT